MSAFRLKTFAPFAEPVQVVAKQRDDRLEAVRDEAYRAGFLAGQAAATDLHLEDQSRLTAELVEALGDACLTNEAARAHVAASLGPVVAAVCAAVTPALADAGLGEEIVRLVDRAIKASPTARPRLRLAPEVTDEVRALLTERGFETTVEAAPELLPREAEIIWDQGYDRLDLDACIAQIHDCIAAHLPAATEGADHAVKRFG